MTSPAFKHFVALGHAVLMFMFLSLLGDGNWESGRLIFSALGPFLRTFSFLTTKTGSKTPKRDRKTVALHTQEIQITGAIF